MGDKMGTEYLNGIRVFVTDMITKDVQARKHKKKRINKKWLKRYGYRTVLDDTKVFVTGDTVFMTKRCYGKLKKKIDSGGNADAFNSGRVMRNWHGGDRSCGV